MRYQITTPSDAGLPLLVLLTGIQNLRFSTAIQRARARAPALALAAAIPRARELERKKKCPFLVELSDRLRRLEETDDI